MKYPSWKRLIYYLKRWFFKVYKGIPFNALDYAKFCKYLNVDQDKEDDVIPQMVPQWDHSPRSSNKAAMIFYNSSPSSFYEHAKNCLNIVKGKSENRQIVILKSWNEWAEGNYMEPDLKYGKGYINALRKAIREVYGY